jgi:hypothetical protein
VPRKRPLLIWMQKANKEAVADMDAEGKLASAMTMHCICKWLSKSRNVTTIPIQRHPLIVFIFLDLGTH